MKCRVWTAALGAIAIICVKPAFAANNGLISQVIQRDSVAFGRVYGDWSAAWWQWVLSIPAASNPLLDKADCNTGQSGPVFFLGGVLFTGGSAKRKCTVLAGKALFFPVLNNIATSFPPPPEIPGFTLSLINDMRAGNASLMDNATGMLVDLDGNQLNDIQNDFRVGSVSFDVTLPDGNIFEHFGIPIPSGEYGTAVDDGYYVMLKPLSPGNHTLHFKGTIEAINFSLDIVYNLIQQ